MTCYGHDANVGCHGHVDDGVPPDACKGHVDIDQCTSHVNDGCRSHVDYGIEKKDK